MSVAVDTNILVRLFTQDHPAEYAASRALLERESVFVSKTVLLETYWVLSKSYHLSITQVLEIFSHFFATENIHLEQSDVMFHALELSQQGMGFADALHLASTPATATRFASFDKALVTKTNAIGTSVPAFTP